MTPKDGGMRHTASREPKRSVSRRQTRHSTFRRRAGFGVPVVLVAAFGSGCGSNDDVLADRAASTSAPLAAISTDEPASTTTAAPPLTAERPSSTPTSTRVVVIVNPPPPTTAPRTFVIVNPPPVITSTTLARLVTVNPPPPSDPERIVPVNPPPPEQGADSPQP